jgi:hypothetical protein
LIGFNPSVMYVSFFGFVATALRAEFGGRPRGAALEVGTDFVAGFAFVFTMRLILV